MMLNSGSSWLQSARKVEIAMKNSRPIFFAITIALALAGCTAETDPNVPSSHTTLPLPTSESTQADIPTGSAPKETNGTFQYDERLPFEQAFTFYIGRQSVDWGHYSIAPAGTEDWVPLRFTGQCNDPTHKHEPWYYSQYQIPYEGSECTKWRIKSEFLPDDPLLSELFPDAEYSCTIWEDVEIINGETVLMYKVSEDDGSHYFETESMPDKYCKDCLNGFGLDPSSVD